MVKIWTRLAEVEPAEEEGVDRQTVALLKGEASNGVKVGLEHRRHLLQEFDAYPTARLRPVVEPLI